MAPSDHTFFPEKEQDAHDQNTVLSKHSGMVVTVWCVFPLLW